MDKIKILMAASEAIPYMKTGGLADVVGSLPKYFDKDRYDVRVILPKYKCMDDKLLPQLGIRTPDPRLRRNKDKFIYYIKFIFCI